jgi:PPIC-type PPIASE domain
MRAFASLTAVLVAVALAAACGTHQPGGMEGPSMNNRIGPPSPPATSRVVSRDILAREPVSNRTLVKHILIGWKDLGTDDYHVDARAERRSKHDAEDQVEALLAQLRAGGDFDQLMKQYSEDGGSAQSGQAYPVTPSAQLVIEFKQLGLRLDVGEIGVCESQFGFHIMKRVE